MVEKKSLYVLGTQHPDADLQREIHLNYPLMRYLYGEILIDNLKRRVDRHNSDCDECVQAVQGVVKFY